VILSEDWFQAVVLSVDPDAVEDADCAVRQDSSSLGEGGFNLARREWF